MGFPLHKLPVKAASHILRRMKIYDQLTYSLCSRNTKNSVRSLGLRAKEILVCISDRIDILINFENSIHFWSNLEHDYWFPDEQFRIPPHIDVHAFSSNEKTDWKWFSANIGIREYLLHFIDVLQHPRIDDLFFNGEHVDTDFIVPVQKDFRGLKIAEFSLGERLTNEFSIVCIESFHHYDQLYLTRIPFERNEIGRMNKILMKNLWRVLIPEAEKITIDQVLISNWEEIQCRTALTGKDFHSFLKLWIKGSNPRLKYFSAGTSVPLDGNVILKGINYLPIPMDNQEVYRKRWMVITKKQNLLEEARSEDSMGPKQLF